MMFLINSLSLFFYPPNNLEVLTTKGIDFVVMLFFAINAFLLLFALFINHSKLAFAFAKAKWWIALINGLTLSTAFILLQWSYFLANNQWQKKSFSINFFILAWLVSAVGYLLVWRLICSKKQSNLSIFFSAVLFGVVSSIQTMFSLLAVNAMAISGINTSYYSLNFLLSICGFYLALSFAKKRFLAKDSGANAQRFFSASICAALMLTIAFCNTLSLNYVFTFVNYAQRVTSPYLAYDVLFQSFFLWSVIAVFVCFIAQNTLRLSQLLSIEQEQNIAATNLSNGIFDAILAFDSKGGIVSFNHAAEQFFGWQSFEILGQKVSLLVSDKHKEFFSLYLKRLISKKDQAVIGLQQEFVVKSKEGEEFPVRMSLGNYQHESNDYFVATVSNIQSLKEQIQFQKEHVKEFQSLTSNLPCVIFREYRNDESHWVYLSDNAKVLTGLSATDLTSELGRAQFLQNIFDEDLSAYQQIKYQSSRCLGQYDVQYRYSINNEVRWFWEIGYCYQNKDASVWADGIIIDLSEKKRSFHFTNKNDDCFVLNALRRNQINKRLQKITQLANLIGKQEQEEPIKQHLEFIANTSKELENFLQSKRADDVKKSIFTNEIKSVSLFELSKEAYDFALKSSEKTAIDFQFSCDDKLTFYQVKNELSLIQILHNMLELSLSLVKQGQFNFSLFLHHDLVRISIEIASKNKINSNVKKLLFDPFDTQLIEQVKGEFWFDTYPNAVLLYLDLPLKEFEVNNAKEAYAFDDLSFSSLNIEAVIIDDVVKNQQDLAEFLWQKGIRLTAIFPQELSRQSLTEKSLIFIDAHSDINIEKLKKLANNKAKFVALIYSLNEKNERFWLNQGFDAVLKKPFHFQHIIQILNGFFKQELNSDQAKSENTSLLFDEIFFCQHFKSFDFFFLLVRSFYHDFRVLSKRIEKKELKNNSYQECYELKNSALSLGFIKLHNMLNESLSLMQHKDIENLVLQNKALNSCCKKSLELAFAAIGIRNKEINQPIKLLCTESFAQSCDLFIQELENKKFNQKHFLSLVPNLIKHISINQLINLVNLLYDASFQQAQNELKLLMKQKIIKFQQEK